MNDSQTLEDLKIDNFEKILIWLVYKNLRRSASFSQNIPDPKIENVFKLLEIKYKFITNPKGNYYVIAKKNEDLNKLENCIARKDFLNPELHRELGTLYGFPPEAVEAYAQNLSEIETQNFHNLVGIIEFHQNFDHYWRPYVGYFVRRGYEMKDAELAKIWADEIRKSLPSVAKAYEQEMLDIKVR